MPRYVIERNFGAISDEDMLAASVRSADLTLDRFPDIVWEHSHLVMNDAGELTTFCVYGAPSEERIREHADAFGSHTIGRIHEIVDEVTPDEVRRRAAGT